MINFRSDWAVSIEFIWVILRRCRNRWKLIGFNWIQSCSDWSIRRSEFFEASHVASTWPSRLLSFAFFFALFSLRFRDRNIDTTTRRNTTARRAILICVCVRANFLRPNPRVTDRRVYSHWPIVIAPPPSSSFSLSFLLFLFTLWPFRLSVVSFPRSVSASLRALVCSLITFDLSLLFAVEHRLRP